MLGKALKLQALMMALVAASCVVEDGVVGAHPRVGRAPLEARAQAVRDERGRERLAHDEVVVHRPRREVRELDRVVHRNPWGVPEVRHVLGHLWAQFNMCSISFNCFS